MNIPTAQKEIISQTDLSSKCVFEDKMIKYIVLVTLSSYFFLCGDMVLVWDVQ